MKLLIVGTHAQVPSALANWSALNISTPEFVPRQQKVATSEMSFHHHSNTLPSESRVHGLERSMSHPATSLNSRISHVADNQQHVGDVPTLPLDYSADSGSVYNGDYTNDGGAMLMVNKLSEHFANITAGRAAPPRGWPYMAMQRRDACSQTASVEMVSTGTGSSSVLSVDACTNTPPYDNSEDSQIDRGTILYASRPTATSASPVQAIDRSEQHGSSDRRLPSNTWADGWHLGPSPGCVENDYKSNYLFRDASKNTTPSTTNLATSNASRHASSSLHFEEYNEAQSTVAKSSPANVPQTNGACDCMFTNCPLASPELLPQAVRRNVIPDQSADTSGSSFATANESGHTSAQVGLNA